MLIVYDAPYWTDLYFNNRQILHSDVGICMPTFVPDTCLVQYTYRIKGMVTENNKQ